MQDAGGTPATPAPQVRTLLLTDLCDSVALVEKLGDAAAAELFQQHDRLVLQLQQQWKGRLIDRSDGLLLLFERPINGLAFAIDYLRGLRELGRARGLVLHARAGMHVGEVLTWHNSAEAVQAGAKSLEVEGLAKPLAARLMALARPGQILLSAVAESLTRRAAPELGESGGQLLWKSHGRWRFKGVPTAQEVFEAGVPGFAPLRMPRSSPKARRDLPLWRHPAALITEVALLVAIGAGAWFITRPEPAIAFAERDWVVLGDVANATENALLNTAVQQALRISLEQSRYVNVVSDLKVRDTLKQMQHDPSRAMDRGTASEVAIRDGARAVLMPSVVELQGQLRVSLEVLDPATGRVVHSEHADGRGLESVLGSIDRVAGAMRLKLGEAMSELSRRSAPLPQVATSSLDALHAYAKGMNAYAEGSLDDARAFFEQATRVDPAFAAAYLAQMRIAYAYGDYIRARELLVEAARHRDHLAPRDALYLDAWVSELNVVSAIEVAGKWKLLGDLYPDYHAAHANQAHALFSAGRYPEAERAARKALVIQNPMRVFALAQVARALLAQNKLDEAGNAFRDANMATPEYWKSELAATLAAHDDFEAAQAIIGEASETDMFGWLHRIAILADKGDAAQAAALATKAHGLCTVQGYLCDVFPVQEFSMRLETGNPAPISMFERSLSKQYRMARQAAGSDRAEWAFMAATSLYMAQRSGHAKLVMHWLPRLQAMVDDLNEARTNQLLLVIKAGEELAAGQAGPALESLEQQLDGTELIQVHVLLRKAYRQMGNTSLSERERQWLLHQRGLAYSENAGAYVMMARNVADVRSARQH